MAPGRFAAVVVEELSDRIVSGALAEGDVLPTEPALCEEFGFSRTVVREALKLLEQRGLVRVEQGRGTTVQPRSSWDLLDPDVLRIALDYDDDLSLLDDLISVRRVLEREMTARRRADSARPRSKNSTRSSPRWRAPTATTTGSASSTTRSTPSIMRASGNEIGRDDRPCHPPLRRCDAAARRRRLEGDLEADSRRASGDPRRPRQGRRRPGERPGVGTHRRRLGREEGPLESVVTSLGRVRNLPLTKVVIRMMIVPLCGSRRSTSTQLPSRRSRRPFAWRRGLRGSAPARTTAVLRITTDDGAVGEAYHEWSGPMLHDIVDRVLRDELVGERADRREWLWHRLWELDRTEEFPIWVFGVVDVALWDLEGKVLGVPVHRLLGTYRDAIPAYASTTTFPTAGGVLRRRRPVPRARLHGDQASRVGRRTSGCRSLPAAPRARRSRCRPDVRRVGRLRPSRRSLCRRALAEARYRWYEEPMREFSVTAYRWLSERVEVPLLVGETSDGSHLNTADFIAVRLRDLRPDECKPSRRDHRRDAHRPSRRLVPAPRRGAWADGAGGASLHGDPELHVLRVARYV